MSPSTKTDRYTAGSIIVHWCTAIAVVALFFTHEGSRGSAMYALHVGGGALVGVFLLWRIWYRFRRGMTAKPDQHALLNLASTLVFWGLLTAIFVTVVSGYVLPWSRGSAIDIFGLFALPSPMPPWHFLHELMEEVHDVAGHLFIPLLALHLLGAAKHAFIDKDGIAQRMFKAGQDGI